MAEAWPGLLSLVAIIALVVFAVWLIRQRPR
jgi:hypothetical protein